MVIAFQTDMTRVISFMMAREGSNRSYRSIGVTDGHHSVTHHQNDPEKIAKTIKIDELHVQSFAYLINKLNSTPDGDGTLLDHSMILVRQQHWRRQHPHAPRSAAGPGGRSGWKDQGRPPHPVCRRDADEQPASVDAGQGRRAGGKLRRQHRQAGSTLGSLGKMRGRVLAHTVSAVMLAAPCFATGDLRLIEAVKDQNRKQWNR